MAFRLYLDPLAFTASGARFPKYVGGGAPIINVLFWSIDFGVEPVAIVGTDLSAADDATFAGEADVFAFPVDLTTSPTTPQVNSIQNYLENRNIPAGWITTALSWTQVARVLLGMALFNQRYDFIYGAENGISAPTIASTGKTLNTTFDQFPAAVQAAMIATAADQQIDASSLVAGVTMRTILKALADQYGNRTFDFNGHLI